MVFRFTWSGSSLLLGVFCYFPLHSFVLLQPHWTPAIPDTSGMFLLKIFAEANFSACSSFHQISTWHGPSPPLSLFLCEHIEVFLDDLKLQPFYLNIPSLFPCFLSLPSVFYLQYMMFFLSPFQNVNFMNSFWASWSLLYFQCLEKWLILSTYSIKFSYLSTASHDCLLSCKLLITWNILF